MSASNRAALITKTYKVLKKHYNPISPTSDRNLLEHLLYACCLENAPIEPADEAFAKLLEHYFDWNEVRVTTIAELGETMSSLPSPRRAAARLKSVLQSVFESQYSFDLESFKKENLGAACKKLESFNGMTSFCIGYVTQAALGGHAIAIDKGALDTLFALGIITEAEAKARRVPGLERAIPKAKGVEFSSLLHQLAADYFCSPFSQRVRGIILEVSPDAKDRFPKRASKKSVEKAAAQSKKKAARPKAGVSKGNAPKDGGKKKAKGKVDDAGKKGAKAKKVTAKAKKTPTPKKKSPTKRLAKKKPR